MNFSMPLSLTRPSGFLDWSQSAARSSAREAALLTRFLLAATGVLVAVSVLAQADPAPNPATLGKAVKVEGLVTVSDTQGIRRVALNDPVIDHTRYVTSSTGSVTLRMDKGCDIELKPNQALTIDGSKSCEALWALVGSGGGNSALVPFAVGGVAILLMGGGSGSAGTPTQPPPGGGIDLPCGGNPADCISGE
jgi:hypothetical protein